MKHIDIRLSLEVVAPLLDLIRETAGELRATLAQPPELPELDEEMRQAWLQDLLQSQDIDLRTLLGLFDGEFFHEGVIGLDEENADPVLRACAAVRLRLRSVHLHDLDDDAMETGRVEISTLPEPRRKAFMCYLFLATLQELVIQHLDPGGRQG